MTAEDVDVVYRLFRDTPDKGKTSELYNHYKRGRLGIMRPRPQQKLALAAWQAGRDTTDQLR